MRYVTGRAHELTGQATETLTAYLADSGYGVIDTPLLEDTELFVRKSGGELTSRLYTFTDPGGHRVSLRPEFTSSVIRHYIEERESLKIPVRWQYCGPVFRYEHGQNAGLNQFTQFGAELVGAEGVDADAEIMHLSWVGLERTGLRSHRLRIGHLGVLHRLLTAFGLTELAKLFIVTNVHALKSESMSVADLRDRAEQVGVLRASLGILERTSLGDISGQEAQEFVRGLLTESIPTPVGRRSTDQIVARLLRKSRDADDPGKFEDALSLVSQLARLDGHPEPVVARGREIASDHGAGADCFDELEALFDALSRRGLSTGWLTLDLGLARGFSYYTGVIFELTHSTPTQEVSLGGGGRYDGLVRALGGSEEVPALGFAYNLDQTVDALARANAETSRTIG